MGFVIWWGGSLIILLLHIYKIISPETASWFGFASIMGAMLLTQLLSSGPCLWWFDEYELTYDICDQHRDVRDKHGTWDAER